MFTLNDSHYADYLRINVRWIRDMNKPASYTITHMNIPYTLVWLVLDGPMHIVAGHSELLAESGDVLLLPPNTVFSLLPGKPGRPIRYLSLCANLKIGNVDVPALYNLPLLTNHRQSPALEPLVAVWLQALASFETLGALIAAKSGAGAPSSGHTRMYDTDVSMHFLDMQSLLYRWLYQFLTLMRSHLPDEPLRFDQRVMKVCGYVQQHLRHPLRLPDLAAQVHVSPSHLSHLFVKALGLSPIEYVLKARMQAAKELLLGSALTVGEIAERVGYDDQSQLSRAFRKAEGTSPLFYRKVNTRSLTGE